MPKQKSASQKTAIVTKFFQDFKDGETVRSDFPQGDRISGTLAENAVKRGWAEWETSRPAVNAPETPEAKKETAENNTSEASD